MAIREIIQLGEKGGDLILKTFGRINKEKQKFIKPVIAKLAAQYTLGKEPKKEPETESEKATSIVKTNANAAATGLNNLARSASSFDPTRFSTGILDSIRGVANKAIIGSGGAVGGAWGKGVAEAATAVTDSMAELVNTGANMATNALNEIKSAQNSAIDTMQKESRMKFFGGETLKNKGYTLQEKSAIIEAASSRFGKIGKPLEAAINRLFEGSVDMQQAAEVASGNFQALGTDQGYFLQQISDSLGSLPPSMKQAMMSQLLPLAKAGMIEQPKEITDTQEARAKLNKQDLEKDKNISRLGLEVDKNGINYSQQLNQSLNDLSLKLVTTGKSLIGSLDMIVSGINSVVEKVSKTNIPKEKAR